MLIFFTLSQLDPVACLITPIGFEEKFIVRSFLRWGRSKVDQVIVVKPSVKNEKTEQAFLSLSKLLSEASTPLSVLEINHEDFVSSVAKIMSWIKGSTCSHFVLNLSSGMRVVGLEILTAFLLLQVDAEIEVEMESFQGVVNFRVRDLLPHNLEDMDLKILRAIHSGERKVAEISRKLKLPLATTWRRVRDLQTSGFIAQEDEGLALTNKGRIFVLLDFSQE